MPSKVKTPKRTRAKQTEIPGSRPARIPAIEKAADGYVELRDQRMALTKDEVAARGVLIAAMQAAKLAVYTSGDYVVTLTGGEAKVRVRKASDKAEANGGDE